MKKIRISTYWYKEINITWKSFLEYLENQNKTLDLNSIITELKNYNCIPVRDNKLGFIEFLEFDTEEDCLIFTLKFSHS